MEMMILLEPMAKGRPRAAKTRGGHIFVYTPKKTAGAEHAIRQAILAEAEPFEAGVPLRLEATFYRRKPSSWRKGDNMPVTRPDLDNYLKLLVDALQKYLFPDDAQITTVVARKRFGDPPRIEFSIEEEVKDGQGTG